MSVLLLSPHRDDAAFSCGLLLARLVEARVPLRIANVCTLSDYAPYADHTVANDPVAGITRLRAEEDAAFVQHLQSEFADGRECVELLDLGWEDAPLRRAIATEDVLTDGAVPADEIARLAAMLRSLAPASLVLVPLAIGGHLDHRLVRQAAIEVWRKDELVFYEDLPYACRMPLEKRTERIQAALPWACERIKTVSARVGYKRRMALFYGSQIAADVADEMEDYGAAMGWTECFYGVPVALRSLAALSEDRNVAKDD